MEKDYARQAVELLDKSGKKYIVVAADSLRGGDQPVLGKGFSAAKGNVPETAHLLARFLDEFAKNANLQPKDVVSSLAILYMMKGGTGEEFDDE